MEWAADFEYSPLEEGLHRVLPNQFEMNQTPGKWTYEENKLFEVALAEIEPASPAFFESVASRIPWKSIEEIKNHYDALIQDLKMIETGQIPIPDYKQQDDSPPNEPKPRNAQQRRRGVPWTEEEHQLFLMGLNKYGKGDWRSISRYYVITKTPTQVASHAQKYFRRQTSSTPADRRRPSIHDIQTVTFSPAETQIKMPLINHPIMIHSNAQNHAPIAFLPTAFPPHPNIFDMNNQASAAFPAGSDFPTAQQYYWG